MNNIVNTIKYKKKEIKNTKTHLNNLVNINETNIILNSHKINVLNDTNMDTNTISIIYRKGTRTSICRGRKGRARRIAAVVSLRIE